jgi:hypothetical protein
LEDRLPEDQFFHLYRRNRIGRDLVVLFLAIGFPTWREARQPQLSREGATHVGLPTERGRFSPFSVFELSM